MCACVRVLCKFECMYVYICMHASMHAFMTVHVISLHVMCGVCAGRLFMDVNHKFPIIRQEIWKQRELFSSSPRAVRFLQGPNALEEGLC